MSKANVSRVLDKQGHEEKDAGEQGSAQTVSSACQGHGHHGTYTSRACKRPGITSTVLCDT